MKVLFLTNIPSPYRVEFFSELGKQCELTVLFEKAVSDERDSSWSDQQFKNFQGIVLKGKSTAVDKAICPEVIRYIKSGEYNHIIVMNVATPTGMLAIQYMKMKKIPYILEGDGAFPKSGKGIKEQIKKHFIKGAKAYLSTAKMHDEYYITYGAKKDRIYRYPFTSLKEEDIVKEVVGKEEKRRLKEKLGIQENIVILSVGRFVFCKGYDILLEACRGISSEIGIYIVGGEPTEEYIQLKEQYKLQNVHFVGFKKKEELRQYYLLADLFVLPTRGDVWGLVINEAMACGVPIITTDKCIAGLELVEDDENGYIVPVNNSKILKNKINKLLYAENKLCEMRKVSLKKIKKYTIQEMAKSHLNILEKL